MPSFFRHLPKQRRVISAIARVAFTGPSPHSDAPITPGPWREARVPAPNNQLIDDYLLFISPKKTDYSQTIPPHFFPQFCLPLLAEGLSTLPYTPRHILNGGCTLTQHAPLPRNQALLLRTRIEFVEERGHLAFIHQQLVIGTSDTPNLLEARLIGITRILGKKSTSKRRPPASLPPDLRLITTRQLRALDGLRFALLTGDFNPIHWLWPVAKLSGFPRTLLHGFAVFAMVWESLDAVKTLELNFFKPVLLPSCTQIHVDDSCAVYVTDAGRRGICASGRAQN